LSIKVFEAILRRALETIKTNIDSISCSAITKTMPKNNKSVEYTWYPLGIRYRRCFFSFLSAFFVHKWKDKKVEFTMMCKTHLNLLYCYDLPLARYFSRGRKNVESKRRKMSHRRFLVALIYLTIQVWVGMVEICEKIGCC
jgi:hypothetical protein